jgi:SulP family sulfate permease
MLDSSAAATIAGFARKSRSHGVAIYIAGATAAIRRTLFMHGVRPPLVKFKVDVDDAVLSAHGMAEASSRAAYAARPAHGAD